MKEIVQDGAKVLRETAKPVPEELFGSMELVQMVKDMGDALDPHPEGVAIAGPQVGIPYRIFVVRKDRTLPLLAPRYDTRGEFPLYEVRVPELEIYINPEIIKTSRKRVPSTGEGCLSIRGIYGITSRHARVTIRARRADGSRFQRGAGGLMAQIFEHEVDHLNGILFTDHAKNLVHIRHAAVA